MIKRNAHRRADGQVVMSDHPQFRWDQRAPDEWAGYSVRSAWREAEPVETPKTSREDYCRYHDPSGMIIVAHLGCLQTAVPVSDLWRGAVEDIARQARSGRVACDGGGP